MTIRMDEALTRRLAGSALGGLVVFAFVPVASGQWLPPPWPAVFPGEIARSLEARGYMLTAPLMRRPGIYLADVSAGPEGYQRLIIDARSGQILERFPAPGQVSGQAWGPAPASRGEEFGAPAPSGAGGPALNGELLNERRLAAPAKKSAHGGLANIRIPAAISPYGGGEPPAGAAEVGFDRTQASARQAHSADLHSASAPSSAARNSESGPIRLAGDRAARGFVRRGDRQTEGQHRPPSAIRVGENRGAPTGTPLLCA